MPKIYLLDSGPLGLLAHDRPVYRRPVHAWIINEIHNGAVIYLSDVADYEVRREIKRLILTNQLPASRLDRLNLLSNFCKPLSLTVSMWHLASDLWATSRNMGKTGASSAALDADVLLAAQTLEIGGTIVTMNIRHFSHLCPVLGWPLP